MYLLHTVHHLNFECMRGVFPPIFFLLLEHKKRFSLPPPLTSSLHTMRPLQMITFSLVLINEALCTTVMFPFVGKFITTLDSSMNESSAGYYSGVLLGAYQGAMTIFCSRWGQVSDVVGRKPVFIIGFCSGAVCMFMVGMSESLWMAILFRILHGMCAANAPLAKTYAAEVTKKEELAAVFGLLSVTWSFGAFLGPMIGGFLYEPSKSPFLAQFSIFSSPDSLFVTRPALLPCAVVALYTLTAAALTSAFLPESNLRAVGLSGWLQSKLWSKRRRGYGLSNQDEDGNEEGDDMPALVAPPQATSDGGDRAAVVGVDEEVQRDPPTTTHTMRNHGGRKIMTDSFSNQAEEAAQTMSNSSMVSIDLEFTSAPPTILHHLHHHGEGGAVVPTSSTHVHDGGDMERVGLKSEDIDSADPTPRSSTPTTAVDTTTSSEFTWGHLFRHPTLRRCVPMYMALCAYNIIYTEILPLYAIALQRDEGLEITTTDIGFVFTANAAISVVMNLLFPHVTKRVPTLVLWRGCNLMFAATVVLNGLTTNLNAYHSHSMTMGWLIFLAFFRCTASTWCFSLSMMFVANAAPPEHLGKVTGMSHACGSLMRSLWPLAAAPLFAWSISAHHWFPFNHHLVFVVSSLLALFAYFMSSSLTEEDVMKTSTAALPTEADRSSVIDDEGMDGEEER